MHVRHGKGGGNCLKNASDGYLFVFDGGSPGWQEVGGQPAVETEILVSRDGASIVDVVYNGSPLYLKDSSKNVV